ncbi:helix-turn-helix domain-containing protein [Streptomyces roseoverticillatus]|uniref:helix-turn-helix domain-containing protein n=1 Tax=Streptomyces roseoverticillatus TaxID=66429 RepID=UPI0022866775|nr:helix-turn-helix domain-containing protein [Streptomyces roseoverticillatus]MCF3103076.1 helix-turn-helix domain-containing protein [Streptomyces roseoverticillatus]
MLEQPRFGQRLKELRRMRGLSQAALVGDGISTGYLSRLESGARPPTERVVTYLAKRLDVDLSAFDVPPSGTSLAQALSIAASAECEEAMDALLDCLDRTDCSDPLLRWQALWLVTRRWNKLGDKAQELVCLEELSQIADELGLPELRCRAWVSLARCLRSTGDVNRAIKVASRAVHIAKESRLSVSDTGAALMALVSAEAEEGRLSEARAHVDELVELIGDRSGTLKAEALWSAATVRFRQGDQQAAKEHLDRAIDGLDSYSDLTLWIRLRLAAASLSLQSAPPQTAIAAERLKEAQSAIVFACTPLLAQELLTLKAHLAFEEERFADARGLLEELQQDELLLAYRDRIRLGVLDGRLLIAEGQLKNGLQQLKELGEEARTACNVDLAAEIWRILAETLENAHGALDSTET